MISTDFILEVITDKISKCEKCGLHMNRIKTVPGEGNINADLMIIGEAPGKDEDESGRPFVGRAGKVLDKYISYLGLLREDVFICNILKCRPPMNRNPEGDEMDKCDFYLQEQIGAIQPKVILLLGAVALKHMTGDPNVGIGKMRGLWLDYKGIPMIATFHPAFLLRQMTDENKRKVKDDMLELKTKLQTTNGESENEV